MRRRSKLLAVALLLAALLTTGGVLGAMLKQVPAFYRDAATVSSLQSERSSALMTRVQDLQNDIRTKPEWSASFEAGDLNCFVQEMICERPGGLLPANCHSPRMAIEGDRIFLGFTHGEGFWSSVVWVELRVWLPKNDTNVIGVEIVSLNAGSLPVSGQSLLETIREAVHEANVELSWYRHDGHPVGLFRFYANQIRPATQIHTLKVADGHITIAGRTRLETTAGRD
jgi:hypothetical protein